MRTCNPITVKCAGIANSIKDMYEKYNISQNILTNALKKKMG